MIALPAGVRILLATKPVDFRRGAHALAALAAAELGTDPFSGVVLVFSGIPSFRAQMVPNISVKTGCCWSREAKRAMRGRSLCSGMVGMSS